MKCCMWNVVGKWFSWINYGSNNNNNNKTGKTMDTFFTCLFLDVGHHRREHQPLYWPEDWVGAQLHPPRSGGVWKLLHTQVSPVSWKTIRGVIFHFLNPGPLSLLTLDPIRINWPESGSVPHLYDFNYKQHCWLPVDTFYLVCFWESLGCRYQFAWMI